MGSRTAAYVACLCGAFVALTPTTAAAQTPSDTDMQTSPPKLQLAPIPPWYSDPFGGMLVGVEAPAGVGFGFVSPPVIEAGDLPSYDYALDFELGVERATSLVAYPLAPGILVTGMLRYVQVHSALEIAMGRAVPWDAYMPLGGGLGLVGAF